MLESDTDNSIDSCWINTAYCCNWVTLMNTLTSMLQQFRMKNTVFKWDSFTMIIFSSDWLECKLWLQWEWLPCVHADLKHISQQGFGTGGQQDSLEQSQVSYRRCMCHFCAVLFKICNHLYRKLKQLSIT